MNNANVNLGVMKTLGYRFNLEKTTTKISTTTETTKTTTKTVAMP